MCLVSGGEIDVEYGMLEAKEKITLFKSGSRQFSIPYVYSLCITNK